MCELMPNPVSQAGLRKSAQPLTFTLATPMMNDADYKTFAQAAHEGRLAYANGVHKSSNPYAGSDLQSATDWEAGWDSAERARQEFLAVDDPGAHPLWHAIVFLGLVTIFFPWSLLLLLVLFGWEGSVQLFRALVIGTLGLAFVVLLVAVVALIVIVFLASIFG